MLLKGRSIFSEIRNKVNLFCNINSKYIIKILIFRKNILIKNFRHFCNFLLEIKSQNEVSKFYNPYNCISIVVNFFLSMTEIEPFNKVFISWNFDRTFILNQNLVYNNISQQNLYS